MQPSYVHTASVPKTFLDKRRELIFNLRAINGGGSASSILLINEDKDYIVFGQDRIVIKYGIYDINYVNIPDQTFSGAGDRGMTDPWTRKYIGTYYLDESLVVPLGHPYIFTAYLVPSEDSSAKISLSYKTSSGIHSISGNNISSSGSSEIHITLPKDATEIKFDLVREGNTDGSVAASVISVRRENV